MQGLFLSLAIGLFFFFYKKLMGKPKMWDIYKTVVVERNGHKCLSQGHGVHICRVFLMAGSLTLI